MNKLVTLKFKGSFEKGFDVNLTIAEEGKKHHLETNGMLFPNTSLLQKYKDWRGYYLWKIGVVEQKGTELISHNLNSYVNPYEGRTLSFVEKDFIGCFQNWLSSKDFRKLEEKCKNHLESDKEIRFLIQTNCNSLQKLPWHKWKLIETFENAEVAIGLLDSQTIKADQISRKSKKIRILAILGNSDDIEVEKDKKILEDITDAYIEFLDEPKRIDINDLLWEQPWDILFFAGHSETSKTDSNQGIISINKNDELNLKELKNGLKKAIKQGLQLAIFNSCDGLGLARELQGLNISQVIVMKEPVQDTVAQNFLEYFLQNFAKENKSLYQSVREARERLEDDKCPYASWLPIIWQNSSDTPKTWNDFKDAKEIKIKRDVTKISLFLILIIIVVRELGIGFIPFLPPQLRVFPVEFLEIPFYDLMMRTRVLSPEPQDDRIVVITIDDKDLEYQDTNGLERETYTDNFGKIQKVSLSDNAFAELLKKLNPHQPDVIGLDILRPVPANNNYLKNQLETNQDLFAICKGKAYEDEDGTASPPELGNARERVGFSDVVLDVDNTVRRYFAFGRFLENSPCLPYQSQGELKYDAPSFSFLVAQHYLEKRGKGFKKEQLLELLKGSASIRQGKAYFSKWGNNKGGPYRSEFNNQEKRAGLQIPLNYRYVKNDEIAANFSLRDILHNYPDLFDRNPDLIKNKIVLIGVTAKTKDDYDYDYFLTPFSHQEEIAGVYLHAHAISQIISAVEDSRPFLSVLSRTRESIWIIFLGSTGIILVWHYKVLKNLVTNTIFATLGLLTIHIIFFINGWWIPVVPALVIIVPPLGVLLSKGKGVFQNGVTIKPNK